MTSSSKEENSKNNNIKMLLLAVLIIFIVILCCSNDDIKNAFGNIGNINGYSNYAYMGRCNTNPKILNVGNKFSF